MAPAERGPTEHFQISAYVDFSKGFAPGTQNSILKQSGLKLIMSRYLIILEPSETGFSAYSPDLPGCVATGADRAQTECRMREAIEFHLKGLRQEKLPVPQPRSQPAFLNIGVRP